MYYNTTNETGDDLKKSHKKAKSQYLIYLKQVRKHLHLK